MQSTAADSHFVILGSPLSPFVRKVLAALNAKGPALTYEVDPLPGFTGNAAFEKISPLCKIPVVWHMGRIMTDSTVICEYIDDAFPDLPALFPAREGGIESARRRAAARWIEEFADTRVVDVFLWELFSERVLRPAYTGSTPDEEKIEKVIANDVQPILEYVESKLLTDSAREGGFLFGDSPMMADFALTTAFRNLEMAQIDVFRGAHPDLAAYVKRVLASPPLAKLRPVEDLGMTVHPVKHPEAFAEMGFPIVTTGDFWGTPKL